MLKHIPLFLLTCLGCHRAADHLTFPDRPLRHTDSADWYDVNGNGKAEFAIARDESGKVNLLQYDDDEDGTPDRVYRLSDYTDKTVPHLIILLDSIPFEQVAARYKAGEFAWFDPPQKMIPVFPSLTEQVFTRLLGAPPLPGMIDDCYDGRFGGHHLGIAERMEGYHQPWEYRCNYVATYSEAALSYIDARTLFYKELVETKKALDESPDRVTISYITSASSMLCKYGKPGCDEVLEQVQRLCLQLLYERQGALKISMCADHGHNLVESEHVTFDDALKQAGFRIVHSIKDPRDVAIDTDGLVTYLGLHTLRAADVADAVLTKPQVELAMYLQQEKVIVRNHDGAASIEYRNGRFRYTPTSDDVLGYREILETLRGQGKIDADGFTADQDWFAATVDAEFPDAPRRLWDAFHGLCISPPEVMLTLRDGFCSGHTTFQKFIRMKSTHGGLNQINSATFLMTMTGRATKPLRCEKIIGTVAPGYVLPIRMKR